MQVPVLVDLNGNHLWVNCEQQYSSKTYQAPFCHSTQCSRANTHQCLSCPAASRPGCHKNTCGLMSTNPITQQTGLGELGQDVLAIHATQGSTQQLGPLVTLLSVLPNSSPHCRFPNPTFSPNGGSVSLFLTHQLRYAASTFEAVFVSPSKLIYYTLL